MVVNHRSPMPTPIVLDHKKRHFYRFLKPKKTFSPCAQLTVSIFGSCIGTLSIGKCQPKALGVDLEGVGKSNLVQLDAQRSGFRLSIELALNKIGEIMLWKNNPTLTARYLLIVDGSRPRIDSDGDLGDRGQ